MADSSGIFFLPSTMKRREDIFLKASPISKDQYRRHVMERCVVRLRNNREMYLSRLRQGGEDDLRACAQDLFEGELQKYKERLDHIPTSDLMVVDAAKCDGGDNSELPTAGGLDEESALFTEEFLIQLMEEISSELGPSWHQRCGSSADTFFTLNSTFDRAGRDSPSSAASTLGDNADFEDLDFFPFADLDEEVNFADGLDDLLLCISCRRYPMRPVSTCMGPSEPVSGVQGAAYMCPACGTRLTSPSSLGLFQIRDRFADVIWRHREHCTIPVAADSDLSLVFEPRPTAVSGIVSEAAIEASCAVCLFRCDIYL